MQVRTLASQVRLDARTKLLNPKWYEGMLSSGYEGVREIQKRLTNTMGWSATSGQACAPSSCLAETALSASCMFTGLPDAAAIGLAALAQHDFLLPALQSRWGRSECTLRC